MRINNQKIVDALVRAASRTLTRAAGMAQDHFITAEKAAFKSPVAFQTSTFRTVGPRSDCGLDYLSVFLLGHFLFLLGPKEYIDLSGINGGELAMNLTFERVDDRCLL